ncbi:MAG: YfhO family protein [Bacilli bacterium]|nr:YfhO family protein [Bacilli bacterium]
MFFKFKYFIKNNLNIILTFICGILIISAIYYLQNVAPFGSKSLLTIDFYHQYGPMLGELYDRIKNGTNLIYSFSMGMGLPFIKNFLNYLSSPFNLIILLFNRDNLLMSFSIIIGIKAVFASTTLIYFLNKKFNINKLYFIPLSLAYGFCAYFTAYYWNIMWLDGMIFLPIIVLGIEKIINDNKYLLYIISLAIMLIANYFIGFMICIFSFLYFIGYLLTKDFKIKCFLKKCLVFAGSSLLAGGLSAVMLLPLFLGMNEISATSDAWPTSQYYAFNFWEFLANHFSGVGSTVFSSGISNVANISVGILSIPLLMLFLINPKIKIKIKCFYLGLIMLLVLSFFYAPLDFIWHAFHVPNDLPYRYSFLYSFILIIISAYSLFNLMHLKTKYISIVYFLNLIFISLLYFLDYENISVEMIILNYIILTLFFMIFLIAKYFPYLKKYAGALFILTIMVELVITINHNWNINQNINNFYSDYIPTTKALQYINRNEEEKMYRIEKTELMTFNDSSWYNYYGQTTFSSMAYENMAILQNYLGIPGNLINSYYYKQNTPIYDLMFNMKYFIGDTWDINRYSLKYNKDNVLVFENNYNVGLMFGVNSDIKLWNFTGDDPLRIQDEFLEKASLVDHILSKLEVSNKNILYDRVKTLVKYTYKNPGDNMYFYINDPDIDFIIVDGILYYNNESIDYYKEVSEEVKIFSYKDFKEKYIINTRTDEEELNIYVGYLNYKTDSFQAYTINHEKYEKVYNILNKNKIIIDEFKESYIAGNVNLDEDLTIYTSIPYDKGWHVKINDKKVETFKIGNCLLAFDANAGENIIELKYRSPGIVAGGTISLLSLLICLALSSKKKKL